METHTREHRSLLANAERRLLIAIAHRLPAWVTSDQLTLLGLSSMVAAGLAFATLQMSWLNVAAFILALAANWFGDSLDGTLARVRCQPRPRYGYYVDHVIDLFGAAVLVGGMACSGLMTAHVALALLAAYYLVSAETFLATHTVHVFRLSFAAVGPTELRILLAIGAVAVFLHPFSDIGGQRYLLLDVSGVIAIVGLVAVFLLSSLRNTRALYRAEPLPRRDVGRAA
jgi:archaetidylinositol phosphate synthase